MLTCICKRHYLILSNSLISIYLRSRIIWALRWSFSAQGIGLLGLVIAAYIDLLFYTLKISHNNNLRGHCWVYFAHRLLCSVTLNSNFAILTLTLQNLTKSYKNYLQNTQHMVWRNRPTLSIGTERLACLNSPPGVQPRTLALHAAGPRFEPRVRRARSARFFSPPSLPSSFGR